MKNIANIIHFARSVEPRAEDDGFLFDTLRQELALGEKYGFPCTVLLQYDALIRPDYQALVKTAKGVEPGLWLEVVRPQAEDAGLLWRGRYTWDWDVRCTFLTGYAPEERIRLIDTAFARFKEIFGHYPAVAGCWTIDALSLAYMKNAYGLAAFCSCKEQFGTDGITLWGGIPFGAYFPSRRNALLPAAEKENQIDLPVFRMLGADPMDQYDLGLGDPDANQKVCSLEPVYSLGGGSPAWVDWFLKENYGGSALSLAYAQFGQENSFGWDAISRGLPMQFEKLKALEAAGKIEVLTLGESGRRYSEAYESTPPNTCLVENDYALKGRRTLWYASKHYRVNLYYENGTAWIRDFQLYADGYAEPYLSAKNETPRCGHFALPVTDGFRFSAGGVRAGIYPYIGSGQMKTDDPFNMCVQKPDKAFADWGAVGFSAEEDRFTVRCDAPGFRLVFRHADLPAVPYVRVAPQMLYCAFRDFTNAPFSYAVRLLQGSFAETPQGIAAFPDETGKIVFSCKAEA